MRHYQRLMRRRAANDYSEQEVHGLRALLESAPGVSGVESIERHGKGGYAVVLDLAQGSVEAFAGVLDANDWVSVI